MRRDWRAIVRSPGVSLVGGLALGALGIGLLILIVVFVIQPAATPEQAGMREVHAGRFVLWYREGSDAQAGRDRLARSLNDTFEQLTQRLGVAGDRLPDPIDVFVHDDLAAMQGAISLRKSAGTRTVYEAPLDLLDGEDPATRLAELVLTFGWGRCGSEILRAGMARVAADPGRNDHAVVAALPDRLFLSLDQLVRLEAGKRLPQSLYEQYDSPYSPASIGSLADLRALLTLSTGTGGDLTTLECASFAQYLVETQGIEGVRRLWQVANTGQLFSQLGSDPAALGAAWRAAAIERGRRAPDYVRLRAQYLLEGGDPDAAYAETSAWGVEGLSQDELLLAARCALVVGAFGEASTLARQAQGTVREEIGAYVTLTVGWEVRTGDRVRILGPAGAADRLLPEAEAAIARIVSRLDLDASGLPARVTVFVYPDAAARREGETLTALPAWQSAALHLLSTDDLPQRLAETLPAYAWGKDTYSQLLRTGVAVALSRDEADLTAEGCALWRSGGWYPLGQVDYGAVGEETVEVESGLLIDQVLDRFGPGALQAIWTFTSPLDRYISLDSALEQACGISRNDINEGLTRSFLQCH